MIPLLRASHFQPTLAVTAITTVLAVSVGREWGAVWVALAVLAGQLSVGWSNDWIDAARDRRAGRVDKPIAAGELDERLVRNAAFAALAACVPLSFLSGWRAAVAHLVAVASAWAYNAGLKNTAISPVPYALSFGLLPEFVTLGLPDHPPAPAWAVIAAALLGVGAHFVNTLADLDADARTGVRGLPHRIGARASLVVGALAMLTAAGVLAFVPPGGNRASATVLFVAALAMVGTVVFTGATGHQRTAWSLTIATAVVALALFLTHGTALVA